MNHLPLVWEEGKEPFISRDENGIAILQRRNDGYIDATAMCRAWNKDFHQFTRLEKTTEILSELVLISGIPLIKLIVSSTGRYGGTWVHPDVAMHLAYWLSTKFAVTVMGWVRDWLQDGRAPSINRDDFAVRFFAKQLKSIDERTERTEQRTERIEQLVIPIAPQLELFGSRLFSLEQFIKAKTRAVPSKQTEKALIVTVQQCYGGCCPATGILIVKDFSRLRNAHGKPISEIDHMYLVGSAQWSNLWLIAAEYHLKLTNGLITRSDAEKDFHSFQGKLRRVIGGNIVSFPDPPQRGIFDDEEQ